VLRCFSADRLRSQMALRAALSIVEGQPVAVQSPARNTLAQGDWAAAGRFASIPGARRRGADFLDQPRLSPASPTYRGKEFRPVRRSVSAIASLRSRAANHARRAHLNLDVAATGFGHGWSLLRLKSQ